MTGPRRGAGVLCTLALAFASAAPAQSGNGVGTPFELAFWQSVIGSDDPAVYEAYLQQYPSGTFSGLARVKLASLRKTLLAAPQPTAAVARPAAPAPAPPVSAPAPSGSSPLPPVSAPALMAPERSVAAVTAAPPAKVAVVTPAAIKADGASDLALLAALAQSQQPGGTTAAVAAAQGFALPQRPVLAPVPDLALPPSFCSADERNLFHDTRYRPLLALAQANNDAALAHMQKLQQAYEQFGVQHDVTPMNAIAAESTDFQQQVAAPAYSRQTALVRQFDALMSVPISPCPLPGTSK